MPPRTNGRPRRAPPTGAAARSQAATVTTIAGLEVEVVRKRVKRLNLRVYPPDGRVRLTVPTSARAHELEHLVRERADWITAHQRRFRQLSAHTEVHYAPGELHYLRGVARALTRVTAASETARAKVEFSGAHVVLTTPALVTHDVIARAFEAYYRRALKSDLEPLLAQWQARLGREVSSFGVKRMSTRWGSCNPRAERIWLNVELARRRPALLEYVVVHELAHLFVPDHGPRFKALMSELLPGWRELGRELDAWPIWARLPPRPN